MIHEFALEPDLVATWGNRHDYRYFIEKFGLGQPRIVSRYPKRWKRLAWEAFRSDNDVEQTRMTDLLARLSERMVPRPNCVWEPERPWLQNAHEEHARVPFHAIMDRAQYELRWSQHATNVTASFEVEDGRVEIRSRRSSEVAP